MEGELIEINLLWHNFPVAFLITALVNVVFIFHRNMEQYNGVMVSTDFIKRDSYERLDC